MKATALYDALGERLPQAVDRRQLEVDEERLVAADVAVRVD